MTSKLQQHAWQFAHVISGPDKFFTLMVINSNNKFNDQQGTLYEQFSRDKSVLIAASSAYFNL